MSSRRFDCGIFSKFWFRRPHQTRTPRRIPHTPVLERLEDRCVPAGGSLPWASAVVFDQFTGGQPTVFGFGVDDGEPDANGDGKSDASGIQKAPEFLGVDDKFKVAVGSIEETAVGKFGLEAKADIDVRLGLEYGYYVNGGTASLLHDGVFVYDVQQPSSVEQPIVVTTSLLLGNGSLFTVSPKISAFADLVVDLDLNAAIRAAFFAEADPLTFGTSIHDRVPLFGINRQLRDENGRPLFNSNGTPKFSGEIEFIGEGLFDNLPEEKESAEDQLEKARGEARKGEIDKREAELEMNRAKTGAQRTAAQQKIDTAQSKIDSGKQKERDVNTKMGSGKKKFGGGEIITVDFGLAQGGLLGLQADLGVGLAAGPASVGKQVGSFKVTLPDVGLTDKQIDSTGLLTASTSAFAFNSELDKGRQLADLTADVGGFLAGAFGAGTFGASLGPISAQVTTVSYDVSTKLNVNQSVNSVPSPSGHKVTFNFTDADTGAPVNVDATALALNVGGVVHPQVRSTGSSITFVPGQKLQIVPPTGDRKIRIVPVLQQAFQFTNDIGLNLDVQGELKVLRATANAFGFEKDTGFMFNPDPEKFLSKDLGSIYKKTFEVKPPDVTLESFVIGAPTVDLRVAVVGRPVSPAVVTAETPNPPLDFRLSVTNAGPATATNVVLTNRLPAQINFSAANSSAGVTVVNGVARINLGTLAAGETRFVTIAGDYASKTGNGFVNDFDVSSDASPKDSDPSNNRASVPMSILLPLTFQVSNETQLRDAITQANNFGSGGDAPLIIVASSAPIVLTQGELVLQRSVVITSSSGMATISGDGKSRVFRISGDTSSNFFRLENLVIRRGNGVGQDEGFGGAIQLLRRSDVLTLFNCIVEESTALTGAQQGGAIFAERGTLVLENVRLLRNRADFGGALALQNARATLTFVEVVGNEATSGGAGVDHFAFNNQESVLNIVASTFRDNRSPRGASVTNSAEGGKAFATFERSSFATSAAVGSVPPANFSNGAEGGGTATLTSGGNNIVTDNSATLTAPGDQPGTQAGLFLFGQTILSGQPGFQVGTLSLIWPGIVGTVQFQVSDNRFVVFGDILRLKDGVQVDASVEPTVTISVTATDETGLQVGPASTTFQLQVTRVNHAPTALSLGAPGSIAENRSTTAEPGTEIAPVIVSDEDAGDSFTFLVSDSRFQVKGNPGAYKLFLKPGIALDFERTASIPLTITATDPAGLPISGKVTVQVLNVLEKPWKIVGGDGTVPAHLAGAVVGKLTTMDRDTDSNPAAASFTYAVNDPRFEVTSESILKLKNDQALSPTTEPIVLTITATDASNLSFTDTFRVSAVVAPPGTGGGSVVQLSTDRVQTTEGQTLVVTLSRTGVALTEARVDFVISAATTLPLRNRGALSEDLAGSLTGTVVFQPNELTKTVTLGTTDDILVEDQESFVLTLTNAGAGTTIGTASRATLVLNDNDLPVVPNEQPPLPRLELAGAGFGKSEEHYRDFVTKAYARFLNRAPDAAGLTFWVTLMQRYETSNHTAGLRQEQIEAGFIASQEYVSIYGGIGEAWVRGIYKDLLNREADAPGVQFWVAQLGAGVAPSNVALGFTSSDERLRNRVMETYRVLLEREADPAGLAFWVAIFKQGGTTEDINSGFVGSNEYYNKANRGGGNPARWTASAYLDILFRPAATSEMTFWLAFLKG